MTTTKRTDTNPERPATDLSNGATIEARLATLERQNRWLRGAVLIGAGVAAGAMLVGLGQPAQDEKSPVVGVAIHSEDDLMYLLREDGVVESLSLQQRNQGPRNRLTWQVVGQ